MAVVFGIDIPVLEFLLFLNIIMLFYVIISMFEIRSLVKFRKELELLLEKFKIGGLPTQTKTSLAKNEIEKPEVKNT